MSAVDDLITWLRAQLDDDERVALAVRESQRSWTATGGWPETGPDTVMAAGGPVAEDLDEFDAAHIARWDPKRALAEIEAQRCVLDEIVPKIDEMDATIEAEWGNGLGPTGESDQLVKLLALPYADRDGYREEWRP